VRYATPLTYDAQGRIQLTTNLINYAELDKKTLIIGMVSKIEIWNPDRLKEIDKKNMKIDSTAYDDLAEKIII
jgi:MraZ protein